jgi:hypothetical protein
MKGSIMRRTICILIFFGVVLPLSAQQQGNEMFVKVFNRLVEEMNNQDYNGIVQEYDKGMSTAFPLFKTSYFFKNNFDTFGKVTKIDTPQISLYYSHRIRTSAKFAECNGIKPNGCTDFTFPVR